MKRQLELETLEKSLILMFKVVKGLVPHYQLLTSSQQPNLRGTLKPKCIKTETTNIIERRLIKNSKFLKVPDCNTEQSKHSFFAETIVHWNQLPDKVVCADSIEAFKTALQEYSP
jgi:hypothetical protein